MNLTISCPACQRPLRVPEDLLGQAVKCPSCTHVFTAPTPGEAEAPPPRSKRRTRDDDYEDHNEAPRRSRRDEKYCVECGNIIRARAELCPNCGVRQPYVEEGSYPRRPSRGGVKMPLLISAISNIIVGLIWAGTCFGIVFTVPLAILCIFEFKLWGQADSLPLREFGRRAKILGIFEIIAGLVNMPTLICGIIVLINAGKLSEPQDHE
jgi:predicted Zn finger-like uncharacterized protein